MAPHPSGNAREERPLRIVQITDPHLGPFMSVARLRRIAERAVARSPDLVFLTGDFLTMESQSDPRAPGPASSRSARCPGGCSRAIGNHDHEAPETVARALATNGIMLLVDEAREVVTDAGPVRSSAWTSRARSQ